MLEKGICLLNTESGKHHSVRIEDKNGNSRDVEIDIYQQKGYQPVWTSLPDCPGTPPRKK